MVKSDRQHRLMVYFKDWFQHKAMEYGVTPLIKFYEYLILQMEEDPSVTFERRCYSELFEDYSREQQLRPVRTKTPWRDDRSPRGGKQGEQKGKGNKTRNDPPNPPRDGGGKGGKGRGRGGVELPQSPAQAAAPGNANSSRRAPAGAGEAPARGPVSGEGHEPEDGDEEEDVMSVANAFEFTPAEPGEGDYIEIERGGGDTGDVLHGGDWWRYLVPTTFVPVWDVTGRALRGEPAPGWTDTMSTFAVAPAPVSETDPETWSVMDRASRRLRRSKKWPAIREKLLRRATQERMEATGTMEHERARYVQEVQSVGAAVPLLTERAHLMAAAFEDWHDVDFLVRGAACGIGWPSRPMEMDEPFHVPNYVGDEHMEAMEREIEKELLEARIFPADDRLPWGVSALGMVEKLRNGKVKYRPVWDYSRPCDVGVNARIELEKDKFSSVKDAYALLRPGYWMVKVDLDSAYRSVGVASQFWPAQCFEFGGVRYMDARAPFGNRALPGIFMRYTRAIVAWMQAQGIPCVGYLDDFFMVAATREEAEEMMMLLVELVSFLGFKVNSAKCEGPEQLMEFLGVELSTSGGVCTAAISKDRVDFVVRTAREVRQQARRKPVRKRQLESLWGLLAFCSQVVWGLSLYTRRGFSLLAASGTRGAVRVTPPVLEDLDTIEDVIRRYNGRKVVLFREDVKEDFFATDSSGTKGMGGLMDERFFLHSWEDVRKMIQKPWFPFRKGVPESEHINYLELFAVWWAVVLWGRHVQGRTVVIRIDNQCALRQVAKWWGPPEYLPLLKQLFLTCVRYDIRLRPVYITTKDNKLADLLSRMQLRQFHMEHRAFMRATVWRQDRDDWMLSPAEFHSLDMEFGPFTLDACVAPSRANAFCAVSWSREEDARVQRFDGHQAWGNLPFSIMYDIIVNFLRCKKRQQMGTSGTFLVPVWGQDRGRAPDPTWTLILSMPEVFKVVECGGGASGPRAGDAAGLGVRADSVVQALLQEQKRYEEEALARSTRGAYSTGARAFVTFCIAFACLGCLEPLLPASDDVLVWFITFSSWFLAPSTIKNYLAAVRQLHLQRGHAWRPVAERFRVAATLQGVRRYWDRPSKPVMPLTLQNLLDMSRHVVFSSLSELSLWAAILVGFFGLFRKDNLTTGKEDACNPRAALVRDDVLFTEDGETVWIMVRYSKTIQCGERFHWVPLRRVPGSALCPVWALRALMSATAGRAGDSPLFVAEKVVGRKVQVVPLTHAGLVGGIKRLAKAAGLRPEAYAGHSLRRGGATAAKQLEVHTMYIKHQGDWRSDCYERYCEMQPEQRLILPGAMAAAAAALT
ncbi:hypothetical protein CYMTET_15032 [Cymbomonas tetramitiformis]|uniref:Reverse transcriptase domain-containing protein n=1 Tax=Cymbomonas tetramitiformis TaxID=36881 RepID=A0AAE0GF62_9CHLO|nr:hypothetical protein CYMTET_15032 [Cymbomonas tetramitiformis]